MKLLQRLGLSIVLGISYRIRSAAGPNLVSTSWAPREVPSSTTWRCCSPSASPLGMAEKSDGTSALAGLVSWLVITTPLKPETVMLFTGVDDVNEVDPAFLKVQNVFVGILCGLIGAWCYNRVRLITTT